MLKFSTRKLTTVSDKKAGSVGPRWIFLTPRLRRARRTITAFCSYQAMLYSIGKSFTLSRPKASFRARAICTRENESLH